MHLIGVLTMHFDDEHILVVCTAEEKFDQTLFDVFIGTTSLATTAKRFSSHSFCSDFGSPICTLPPAGSGTSTVALIEAGVVGVTV